MTAATGEPVQERQSIVRRIAPLAGSLAFAALVVLALGFPFEPIHPILAVSGVFVLTTVEVEIGALLVLWVFALMAQRRFPSVPRRLVVPVLLWLGILSLSTLFAPNFQENSVRFMSRIASGLMIGWAAFDLVNRSPRRKTILVTLALSGTVISLLGLGEALNITPLVRWLGSFKFQQTHVAEIVRVSSTLSYATITSMVLEMILPLMVSLALLTGDRRVRIGIGLAIAVVLMAMVLTLSRAGVIVSLVTLAFMAGLGLWQHRRDMMIGAAATSGLLIGTVALTLIGNPVATLRLNTETERNWYQADVQAPEVVAARPGETVLVPVHVTNVSVRTWESGGSQPIALSYHLYDSTGTPINYDGARSPLPGDVPPGQRADLQAQVAAPEAVGEYVVEWDMVQENVAWFSWKDNPTSATRLTVAGSPANGLRLPPSIPPLDVRITTPAPGRFELWRAALEMALAHPLLGVGPDNFRWEYGSYAGVERWDTGIHANSLYIEWLADTGLPGLLAFLWVSWTLGSLLIAGLRAGYRDVDWILLVGLVASILAWYVHGFVDYFFEFTPTYVLFWLVTGIAIRMSDSYSRGAYADRV